MIILHRPTIVTSEKVETGSIVIEDGIIKDVLYADAEDYDFRMSRLLAANPEAEVRELAGKHVIAGGIDAHVHFREPGMTAKADMHTESMAAAAGGVCRGGAGDGGADDRVQVEPGPVVWLGAECGGAGSAAAHRYFRYE